MHVRADVASNMEGFHHPNSRGLQHGGENGTPVSSIAPEVSKAVTLT